MLGEMDVINAVINFLYEKENCKDIKAVNGTKEKGPDITVKLDDGETLKIEAKGQGSSDPNSNRYGDKFTSNQKLDHVSKALYTACTYVTQGFVGGIALPGDSKHRELIERITKPIHILQIRVFFVDEETRMVDEFPR